MLQVPQHPTSSTLVIAKGFWGLMKFINFTAPQTHSLHTQLWNTECRLKQCLLECNIHDSNYKFCFSCYLISNIWYISVVFKLEDVKYLHWLTLRVANNISVREMELPLWNKVYTMLNFKPYFRPSFFWLFIGNFFRTYIVQSSGRKFWVRQRCLQIEAHNVFR